MEPGEIQMMITRIRKVPPELRAALLLYAVTLMASDQGQEIISKDFEFPDHVPPTTAKHVVILDYMARGLEAYQKGAKIVRPPAVWLGQIISAAFPHLASVEDQRHVIDFQSFLSLIFGPNGQLGPGPASGSGIS